MARKGVRVREEAVVFGGGSGLSGVVTAAKEPASRIGVLLLSAGFLHRVGPERLHVKLARALSADRLPSLRFDFSGIGESEPRTDAVSYEERTLLEARAAMEVLERRGVERFVVFGVCAGADNALRIAIADPRVTAAILVQPYSFMSRGYRWDRYGRELLSAAAWARLLRGRMDIAAAARNLKAYFRPPRVADDRAADVSQFWKMPPAERIRADLRTLVANGTRLLFLYTHRSPAEFNYRAVMRRALKAMKAGAQVQVRGFRGTDHTFSPLNHQARIVEQIVAWTLWVDGRAESPQPCLEIRAGSLLHPACRVSVSR
jgi:pimeloyl-ACP methyl ester carboxylesterase